MRVRSKRTLIVMCLAALAAGASASATGGGTATADPGMRAERPLAAARAVPLLRATRFAPTGRIRGWLHTEGTSIVDAAGRVVTFRGVDVSGMGHGWGSASPGAGADHCPSWTPPPVSEVADVARSGFNVVRVSFSWSNLEPNPPAGGLASGRYRFNVAYLRALSEAVRSFTARGVAVILQMAQNNWSPAFHVPGRSGVMKCGVGMPAWLYGVPSSAAQVRSSSTFTIDRARRRFFADRGDVQRAYAAAWAFVAGRFSRNHLVVGADMMNEPFTRGAFPTSDLHLDRLYDTVGSAIRAADPHLLLVFQDSQYHGPRSLALQGPPALPDVVYTFHLYDPVWTPGGLAMTRTYLRRARTWNVPLWISEFDAFGYASPSGTRVRWAVQLERMLRFCKENDVGWSEFAYARRWMLDPATGRLRAGLLPALRGVYGDAARVASSTSGKVDGEPATTSPVLR